MILFIIILNLILKILNDRKWILSALLYIMIVLIKIIYKIVGENIELYLKNIMKE